MNAVADALSRVPRFPALRRARLDTLQVNLGYRCNQACSHCHVDAGPARTESMSRATLDAVLDFMRAAGVATLDLTGGAPELNPHFRNAVAEARAAGVAVIDRCNLTVLEEPGQADLAAFLAAHGVRVVASLPCYSADNVDAQRGRGVYARSLRGIEKLNAVGYGMPGSPLVLDFVYNPRGPSLPPDPAVLEADYKTALGRLGIHFNRVLTITNMPIRRFRHELERDGRLDDYMELLVASFSPDNLPQVMCRGLLSVDWRGYVYDCDFNQMLGLPVGGGAPRHVSELDTGALTNEPIAVGAHCFGCTAGRGSSCGGALRD
ncbi:MAG: arsenosugar biosynthesis radical SAM protein ArsS [Gammaproteobacteria bacterium]